MAYGYCHKCDAELDDPEFSECIAGVIVCHKCGHDHQLNHDEKNQALIQLEERISNIEAHLGIIP